MQSQPAPLSAEEKLRLQAQLVNVVEQAVLAVDLAGHILFWNRYAETLYGWSAAEVQGRLIGEVFTAPLLMESALANLEQLRRGEGWSGEFRVQRRDSTTCMVHFSASSFQMEQRTLISLAGFSLDGMDHQPLQKANRLLAEASAQLADAVDYEAPLMTLAQLAVPQLADWCAVHLLQADGSIEQVALAPAEMAKLKAVYDWLQNHLPEG